METYPRISRPTAGSVACSASRVRVRVRVRVRGRV